MSSHSGSLAVTASCCILSRACCYASIGTIVSTGAGVASNGTLFLRFE